MQYPGWAKHCQGDINHILDQSYGHLINRLDPLRTVITVHDIAPLRFPGRSLGISGFVWKLAWRGVLRAQHIIVVSQFSAQEALPYLTNPDVSFYVVPQGTAPHFRPLPPSAFQTLRLRYVQPDTKLLLHVGSTHPRKNVSGILKAISLLRQVGTPVVFVQVGGMMSESLAQLIENLDLSDSVYFVGSVPEEELVAHYNAADLFIFPSLYEGFGMPVLEAMACGVPVLTSNVASLPEVAGDAAVLIEPQNPQALADAAQEILSSPDRIAELSSMGLDRAARFTWNVTAQKTLAVYRSVADSLATR